MQVTKPIHITAIGSTILVVILGLVLSMLKWTESIQLSWWILLVIVIGTGVISLVLFAYLINRFVNRKIKFIYSIITNKQEPDRQDFSLSEEAMVKLTEDTAKWAKVQKKQIQDLKKQAAFRKEFLGNLAHELKTPVFSIQGYILTLLEGGLEDERVNRDFLVRALSGVDRISNLLDDLDEIARFETDRFNLKIQKFDLVQLIRNVFDELESKAKKKSIELTFSRHYEPLFVMADKKRLTQVIVNLISNSISYGVENGKTIVAIHPVDRKTIRVEVIDNGVGMSEEHIPRLFERFYRVDKSRERNIGGSGLGLAIVKHVIEAHKQSISVKSTEGVGSTFAFTIERA